MGWSAIERHSVICTDRIRHCCRVRRGRQRQKQRKSEHETDGAWSTRSHRILLSSREALSCRGASNGKHRGAKSWSRNSSAGMRAEASRDRRHTPREFPCQGRVWLVPFGGNDFDRSTRSCKGRERITVAACSDWCEMSQDVVLTPLFKSALSKPLRPQSSALSASGGMIDRYSDAERNASAQKFMLRAPATGKRKRRGHSARGAFRCWESS